jgi:hypothetical protein
VLGRQLEPLTAGHQDGEERALGEQRGQLRSRIDHVLEVVEEKQ